MHRGVRKEWKKLLERHGFEVIGINSKSHFVVQHRGNGGKTTIPGSPGRGRAFKNAEADLRRIAKGHYLQPVG